MPDIKDRGSLVDRELIRHGEVPQSVRVRDKLRLPADVRI